MYQKTTLPNGLRIVTSTMPHTRSVSINIFIGAGSRYERPAEAGISHFLEHLFFKGTEHRPTAKAISEAIESVGGVLNAGTDRELTVYWSKVGKPHFALALDVLVDMLRRALFDPAEIEKERQVVLEELSMTQDSPAQWVDTLFDELMWPDQPLGRDVAGTQESVSGITRPMLFEYMGRQYGPSSAVVSIAGDIRHEAAVESVAKAIEGWPEIQPGSWFPVVDGQSAPRLKIASKKTEQAHICLGVHGLSSLHPDRYALDLLNVVLGEGMSSRLFLEVREKRGLAYDVHSYVNHYLDAGALTVYAGVDPKRSEPAIEAIMQELVRIKEDLPEAELVKAKEFTKGRMFLRMEDTRSVAGWLGAQELLLGEIKTVDEVAEAIDKVTPEDIKRVARELFVTEQLNLAIVGPFRREDRFAKLLQF